MPHHDQHHDLDDSVDCGGFVAVAIWAVSLVLAFGVGFLFGVKFNLTP